MSRTAAALWLAIAAAPAAAAWLVAVPVREPSLPPAIMSPRMGPEPLGPWRGAMADSLVRATVARAPFRAGRRPSDVPYDPSAPRPGDSVAPSVPKPALVLTGIVWGAEPAAIVEGLPGTAAARVIRRGDVIGPLAIARITRDSVMVTGMDTTWTLSVREVGR